ncbi:hypothetical protein M0811_14752 [Anaeramoeba ignava]|uniref:Fibronectin type-III domain-containing protein n=1 Tax=Anaeramoeba ignava TaxID=1746090 RepID=A0A9Q0LTM7_ANAIG|nr:hypothetical protein M0811_14752 [Anaeramoeba ignava]
MKLNLFFSFFFFLIINIFLIQSNQNQNQKSIQSSLISISPILKEIKTLTETTRYYSSFNEAWIWNLLDQFSGSSGDYFGWSVSIYKDVLVIGTYYANQAFIYRYNGTNFNQEQTLNESVTDFGRSVSVYENVIVIGTDGAKQVFIYRYNGTIWNQEQILNESVTDFGYSVSIYENVTVIGTYGADKAFIYRYNGTFWNQEQMLSEPASYFGISVSIYGNVTVIGTNYVSKAFIYRYNESIWNLEQNLYEPSVTNFGYSVSIYENVTVIGTNGANQAYIYRYNGLIWNQEQILNESSVTDFGYSVSIYENVTVIGTNANKAFIYRYNGLIWNQEQNLNESVTDFGDSVSIYENFTVIGAFSANQTFVYEVSLIPQVNIINCSSSFSSFDCYWNKIEFPSTLKYQINYGYDWIDIDYPILENENVYYQQFNSSIYDNITGNEYYSIQIKACDNETSMKCGESSSFINLTTKIDSVKDFQLSNPSNNSINVTWNYPNVQINEGIAHLDHYNLSYFIQSQPDLISFISVDNSSLDYLLNNLESENDYNISICGCRTHECEGDDKGEIVESSISLLFGEVTNLTCSIQYSLDINCNWNQPINCSIPFYYNLTYQSIYQNDSGNYQPTSLNQQFTAQFQNQEYQINISACNSNGKCGDISSISIKTDNLTTSPTIYETISKIEEIEFNFTKLTNANNYSISLNNGTSWQNFTSLDLSGNEVIGIISEISGNIEYNISIRGCVDLNCETPYLGEPSSIISTRAKLGNITSLKCDSLINGFICTWNSLILSSGLKAYSFTYNSTSICLTNLINYYSISGLQGGEYYEISVQQSSTLNCLNNEYSGINSTTSITTLSPYQPTQSTDSNNSNTTAITIGIFIPILIILIVIIAILLYQKKTRTKKQKQTKNLNQKQEEKELQDDLDI